MFINWGLAARGPGGAGWAGLAQGPDLSPPPAAPFVCAEEEPSWLGGHLGLSEGGAPCGSLCWWHRGCPLSLLVPLAVAWDSEWPSLPS